MVRLKKLVFFTFFVLLLTGCGGPSMPTQVHVVRSSIPSQHLGPFKTTVTNTTDVQHLYTAALALPTASGVANCPVSNSSGITYHMIFSTGSTTIQKMDFDMADCLFLKINTSDVRLADSSFITLFITIVRPLDGVPTYSNHCCPQAPGVG